MSMRARAIALLLLALEPHVYGEFVRPEDGEDPIPSPPPQSSDDEGDIEVNVTVLTDASPEETAWMM